MADVYTNTDGDNFPGARDRTRPGTAPGEIIHDIIVDADGNRVSNKPANTTLLAAQKARLEREKQKRERASSSSGSILPKLLLLAIFIPLLSHFMVGNYHFNAGPTVGKYARGIWRHPSNPFTPGELTLTTVQLSQYDGSDPSKPIYLAIRGEVFDVSANPRIYGKGGAYNMMAGRDASRAFVTGCFQTHQTHDLRGLSDEDLKALDGWTKFFTESDKYFKVGTVLLPKIKRGSPIPQPCNVAGGEEAPAHHGKGGKGGGGGANPHAKTQGKAH